MKLREIFILFFKTNTLQKQPVVYFSVDVNLDMVDTFKRECNIKQTKRVYHFLFTFPFAQ